MPETALEKSPDRSSRPPAGRGPDRVNHEPRSPASRARPAQGLRSRDASGQGPQRRVSGRTATPRQLSVLPPCTSRAAPRRTPQLHKPRPLTRRFSDTWLGDLKTDSRLAPHTPPATLPPQKQMALRARNVAKLPSSFLGRCDKHPTKWRQRRRPTIPRVVSSATYAARTRLRDTALRAPAAPRKGGAPRDLRAGPEPLHCGCAAQAFSSPSPAAPVPAPTPSRLRLEASGRRVFNVSTGLGGSGKERPCPALSV